MSNPTPPTTSLTEAVASLHHSMLWDFRVMAVFIGFTALLLIVMIIATRIGGR